MRLGGHALALLAVAACWLAPAACAQGAALAGDVEVTALSLQTETTVTATAPADATPQPTPKREGRIRAPDGKTRPGFQELAVSDTNTVDKTQAFPPGAAGAAPIVVLVAGGVVIGIVAVVFQSRRAARKHERDESDPMQQSLLFHDMDYAAM